MVANRILFAGLGNYNLPNTRHNAGMMILDHLAKALELTWVQHKPWKAHIAQTTLTIPSSGNRETHEIQLTLLKPRLLMNVSGPSVARAVRDLSIPDTGIYVFQDDLQRELGKVSLKSSGSANGHNGIKSVIQHLGTDAFWRVRLGIGRPDTRDETEVADFVLSKFLPSEMEVLETQVYPLLKIGPGLGLETLLLRNQLWRPPALKKNKSKSEKPHQNNNNNKQQQQQQQQQVTPPPEETNKENGHPQA